MHSSKPMVTNTIFVKLSRSQEKRDIDVWKGIMWRMKVKMLGKDIRVGDS